MKQINGLIESVLELLREDQQCIGYRFVSAYPDKTVQNPVEQAIVSVGLSSLTIRQSALGEVIGRGQTTFQTGRQADWELHIHIYAPRSLGGKGCYDIFSAIAAALLERQNEWKIGDMSCGKTSYNRDTRTFVLEGFVQLTTLMKDGV